MEKKSICKSITAGKEYANKFAAGEMLYPWNIQWENGDAGQQTTKKNEPPYIVGKEYPYEMIVGEWGDGKPKVTFKKVNPEGAKFKRKDEKLKLYGFSISYATRFVSNGILPRPTGDELANETNESWNLFLTTVKKYAKSIHKEMLNSVAIYGEDHIDAYGTAMSNAINLVLEGKINKDKVYVYYQALLDAVLVKQVINPTPAQ